MAEGKLQKCNLNYRRFKPTEIRMVGDVLGKRLSADEKKRGFFRVFVKSKDSDKRRELWVRAYDGGICSVIVYVLDGGDEKNPKNWTTEFERVTRTHTQFLNSLKTAMERYSVISSSFSNPVKL